MAGMASTPGLGGEKAPSPPAPRRLPAPVRMAVLLFEGFELLDVCAPAELLGAAGGGVAELVFVSTEPGAPQVVSSTLGTQGPALLSTHAIREGGNVARAGTDVQEEGFDFDALLVPGGAGVRREQHNEVLLRWLRDATRRAATRLVFSVCTGSWLLAAAGCLDGMRATSNRAALRAGHPQRAGPATSWELDRRWVEHWEGDTLFLTSAGVSAGGDAALRVVELLGGDAAGITERAEWTRTGTAEEDGGEARPP